MEYPTTVKGRDLKRGDVVEGKVIVTSDVIPQQPDMADQVQFYHEVAATEGFTPESGDTTLLQFDAIFVGADATSLVYADADVTVTTHVEGTILTTSGRALFTTAAQLYRLLNEQGGSSAVLQVGDVTFDVTIDGDDAQVLIKTEGLIFDVSAEVNELVESARATAALLAEAVRGELTSKEDEALLGIQGPAL